MYALADQTLSYNCDHTLRFTFACLHPSPSPHALALLLADIPNAVQCYLAILTSPTLCSHVCCNLHTCLLPSAGAGVTGLAEHERNKHSGSGYGTGSGSDSYGSSGARGVGATGTGSNYDSGSNQGAALTTGNVRSHLPGTEDNKERKAEQSYGQGAAGGGVTNSGSGNTGRDTGYGSGTATSNTGSGSNTGYGSGNTTTGSGNNTGSGNDTTTGSGGGATAKLKAHLPGTKEYKAAHGQGTGSGTGSGDNYGSNTGSGNTGSGSHTGRDTAAGQRL